MSKKRKPRTWFPKLRATTHQGRREKRERTRQAKQQAAFQREFETLLQEYERIRAELEADTCRAEQERVSNEIEDREMEKSALVPVGWLETFNDMTLKEMIDLYEVCLVLEEKEIWEDDDDPIGPTGIAPHA